MHEASAAASSLLLHGAGLVAAPTAGEVLSRRCTALLRRALVVWPNADPKLAWMDKLFQGLESSQHILGNVCAGLELLTFLVAKLRKEQTLLAVRAMTRGLVAVCSCSNLRVVRLLQPLLHTLFATFGVEELDDLVSRATRLVQESVANYERGHPGSGQVLYPALMVFRALSQHTTVQLDRMLSIFVKLLQRVARDHIQPPPQDNNPRQ